MKHISKDLLEATDYIQDYVCAEINFILGKIHQQLTVYSKSSQRLQNKMKGTHKWNLTLFHTPKGFSPEVNSYANMFIYRNETLICGVIKYRASFIMQDYSDVFISDSLHKYAHFTVCTFLSHTLHYLVANACLEFSILTQTVLQNNCGREHFNYLQNHFC